MNNKTLTIISEYNPLHIGHKYHIEQSKKLTNCDYTVCILSGNFVQRGEPSIINKWEKTKTCLDNGFDLVIELPCLYAISSAENFANGAIKIANQISPNGYLSFGSEDGNVEKLNKLTNLISENENTYIQLLKQKISEGYSYPKSQELVIDKLFENEFSKICSPNNILGLEYLKSLKSTNSKIIPLTIKRQSNFPSSSQIRSILRKSQSLTDLKDILPTTSFDILEKNINEGTVVLSLKKFEKEIIYTLRKMNIDDLKNIPDLSENLVTKFKKASDSCNNLEKLIELLKNKSITQARLQRILLYILLGITKNDMEMSKQTIPYIRVLGTSNKGKEILPIISKSANLITSVKTFEDKCTNKNLLRMLEIDKLATNIYTLAYTGENSKSNLDYITKLIESN